MYRKLFVYNQRVVDNRSARSRSPRRTIVLKNRKKVSYEFFVPKVGVGISKSKMKGPNGRNVVIGINMHHSSQVVLFYDFSAQHW